MRLTLILLIGLISASCADLQVGRSYLSEMNQDDSSFFTAGEDFPVLAGDTGKSWRSNKEIASRTPASEEELFERRSERSLRDELSGLENSQNEHALNFYQLHKHKFGNISEKIYFLKLPNSERKDYLENRGFIDPVQESPKTAFDKMRTKRNSDVILGMSKDDVRGNLGKPQRVEIAGNPSYENERWAYTYNGATKYIYFESGRVEGWE